MRVCACGRARVRNTFFDECAFGFGPLALVGDDDEGVGEVGFDRVDGVVAPHGHREPQVDRVLARAHQELGLELDDVLVQLDHLGVLVHGLLGDLALPQVRFAYNGRLDLAHARQVHVCACAIGIELRLVSAAGVSRNAWNACSYR